MFKVCKAFKPSSSARASLAFLVWASCNVLHPLSGVIRLDYQAYSRMVKRSHSIVSKLPENAPFLSKGFS